MSEETSSSRDVDNRGRENDDNHQQVNAVYVYEFLSLHCILTRDAVD